MDSFEIIRVEELEKIVVGLPKKRKTEEGINSDILTFYVIKKEFVDIINKSLKEGYCPEG